MAKSLLALALIVLALGASSSAQQAPREVPFPNKYYIAGITDDSKVGQFLQDVQRAIKAGDKFRVAELVSYPLFLGKRGGAVVKMVANKKQFVAEYDRIMTPHIRSVILRQKLENAFYNYEGFRIGRYYDVWFGAIDNSNTIRIIQVNCE
jgi:hypothetical protein